MAILSGGCEPDSFVYHGSLKFSFTNICGLHFNQSWIKLFWHSGSWLNLFWKFLCNRLFPFNLRGFYCSFPWSCRLCEGRTSFCMGFMDFLQILTYVPNWLYYTQYFTSFSSVNHLLCLYAQFLILFHQT